MRHDHVMVICGAKPTHTHPVKEALKALGCCHTLQAAGQAHQQQDCCLAQHTPTKPVCNSRTYNMWQSACARHKSRHSWHVLTCELPLQLLFGSR